MACLSVKQRETQKKLLVIKKEVVTEMMSADTTEVHRLCLNG